MNKIDKREIDLNDPNYVPDQFIRKLIEILKLKNQTALSYDLEINFPTISKMRHRIIPIGPTLLIRAHELTGLSSVELKNLMWLEPA